VEMAAMMSNAQQISEILESNFFKQDAMPSFRLNMSRSFYVEVVERGGSHAWQITFPDGNPLNSLGAFRSWGEAKSDLRQRLEQMRQEFHDGDVTVGMS
jgi:hypothetical protein